jgi:hypothetical protein
MVLRNDTWVNMLSQFSATSALKKYLLKKGSYATKKKIILIACEAVV